MPKRTRAITKKASAKYKAFMHVLHLDRSLATVHPHSVEDPMTTMMQMGTTRASSHTIKSTRTHTHTRQIRAQVHPRAQTGTANVKRTRQRRATDLPCGSRNPAPDNLVTIEPCTVRPTKKANRDKKDATKRTKHNSKLQATTMVSPRYVRFECAVRVLRQRAVLVCFLLVHGLSFVIHTLPLVKR
jgi:hypothetical protein